MPYDITVKDVPTLPVVATRFHTSLAQVASDFQSGFMALAGSGHPPVGPPFAVLHDVIDEENDGEIELCFPVASAIDLEGDIYGAEVPASKVASTIHVGPYSELSPAYHAITEWVQAHGHEFAASPREIYLNDPTSIDESEYLTEVQWPIT